MLPKITEDQRQRWAAALREINTNPCAQVPPPVVNSLVNHRLVKPRVPAGFTLTPTGHAFICPDAPRVQVAPVVTVEYPPLDVRTTPYVRICRAVDADPFIEVPPDNARAMIEQGLIYWRYERGYALTAAGRRFMDAYAAVEIEPLTSRRERLNAKRTARRQNKKRHIAIESGL